MGLPIAGTMTIAEAAQIQALDVLAALPESDWDLLHRLARRHTSGHLSAAAWATASGAVIGDALRRVMDEGRIAFGSDA